MGHSLILVPVLAYIIHFTAVFCFVIVLMLLVRARVKALHGDSCIMRKRIVSGVLPCIY